MPVAVLVGAVRLAAVADVLGEGGGNRTLGVYHFVHHLVPQKNRDAKNLSGTDWITIVPRNVLLPATYREFMGHPEKSQMPELEPVAGSRRMLARLRPTNNTGLWAPRHNATSASGPGRQTAQTSDRRA